MKLWEKFLVFRRDGSVPEWPYLVLGGRDPEAIEAVRDLAEYAADHGRDPDYVSSLRELANRMDAYMVEYGEGDPDAAPHRTDDPWILQTWESRRGPHTGTVPQS